MAILAQALCYIWVDVSKLLKKLWQTPNKMVSAKGQLKAGATSISPSALPFVGSSMSFHLIGGYLASLQIPVV